MLFADEEIPEVEAETEETEEVEMEEEELEDYDVYATWSGEDADTDMYVGSIELTAEATFIDMPKELEINGHIYKLED